MKIIYNNIIPPEGYKALCLWPFVFVRRNSNSSFSDTKKRHEHIHGEQEKELLLIFFLLWYGIEWIARFLQYRDRLEAYYNISFEREAYANQFNSEYLKTRRHFAWLHYLRNK